MHHRKQLKQTTYKAGEKMTWGIMTWKQVNQTCRWSRQASRWSRSTSNQLNLFQLTDKLKRLTESSDQLNKNSDIQFWTSPYRWLLQDWLLCLHSAWTKLNSFYLNSSWHMLPMTYLGFCTCQIPSFCWWFGGSDHWTAQLFWVIIKWNIYFSLIEVAYIKK